MTSIKVDVMQSDCYRRACCIASHMSGKLLPSSGHHQVSALTVPELAKQATHGTEPSELAGRYSTGIKLISSKALHMLLGSCVPNMYCMTQPAAQQITKPNAGELNKSNRGLHCAWQTAYAVANAVQTGGMLT